MTITCTSPLSPQKENDSLFSLYDIDTLEFELSEALDLDEVFLCIDLEQEAVHLYRDMISVQDGQYISAELHTGNFLDILKDLQLASPTHRLGFQMEYTIDDVFKVVSGSVEIKNPWL